MCLIRIYQNAKDLIEEEIVDKENGVGSRKK